MNDTFLDTPTQESWRMFRIMAEFVEGFEELAQVGVARVGVVFHTGAGATGAASSSATPSALPRPLSSPVLSTVCPRTASSMRWRRPTSRRVLLCRRP